MQKTLSVINLTAIRKNALILRSMLEDKFFFAVVKADAYGHGAVEVSREIEDIADGFCVAIADEGVSLRIAGITKPILVLAPPMDREDVERCAHYSLTVTVNSVQTARLIGGLNCHVKINTGMNRYGCNLEELDGILKILHPRQIKGVYSHLYAADVDKESKVQLELFRSAAEKIKAYADGAIAHLAASAGVVKGGEYLFDGARCGIALYGYAPCGFSLQGLQPALKVYARRVQSTSPVGGGVGYNIAEEKYKSLSTYRLGYADGFSRVCPLGEKTLCMDAFISKKDDDYLCVFDNADEYARKCGTISYEVLCSVTRRSQKIYERSIAP